MLSWLSDYASPATHSHASRCRLRPSHLSLYMSNGPTKINPRLTHMVFILEPKAKNESSCSLIFCTTGYLSAPDSFPPKEI